MIVESVILLFSLGLIGLAGIMLAACFSTPITGDPTSAFVCFSYHMWPDVKQRHFALI